MKGKTIKYLIFTPAASFYKIRLFNEVDIALRSKGKRLLVVFTNEYGEERAADFTSGEMTFDYEFLVGKNRLERAINALYLLYKIKFEKLIVCGWDTTTKYILPFFSRKRKNTCIVESSIYESQVGGIKSLFKRIFLWRCSTAYVSGFAQRKLVEVLHFKGKIVVFGGCGLLNYQPQPKYHERNVVKTFLYVGRLSPEKNIELLIDVFNDVEIQKAELELKIIGYGPNKEALIERAANNPHISFLGEVKNLELPTYYFNSDVFVLPSLREPWGLVVEEALNNGTPVIVSDAVGCKDDLVSKDTGLVFISNDFVSLKAQVIKIMDVTYYNKLRRGISMLDFEMRKKRQVEAFID